MPIYEYECLDCGQETEVIQRFTDAPLVQCGRCQGRLEKKISVSSFHLKGSGWYVTDYARKNSNETPASVNDGNSKEKTESASTPETKTASDSGAVKAAAADSSKTTATTA